MNKIDDGGYVHPPMNGINSGLGITLRQYYAGQALQGLLSDHKLIETYQEESERTGVGPDVIVAGIAFAHADAMIAEGKKGGE